MNEIYNIALSNEYKRADSEPMKSSKGWVEYGDKNDFGEYLDELSFSSPTHAALCQRIAQLIHGTGMSGLDAIRIGLDKAYRAGCYDYWVQGGFYLEVIMTKGGEVSEVNHIRFKHVRPSIVNEGGNIVSYWFNKDWKEERESVEISALGFNVEGTDSGHYIMFVGERRDDYFPKPVYIGGIDYIELEKSIGRYQINHMENGMSLGWMVSMEKGGTTKEDRQKIVANLEAKTTGSSKAGKGAVVFYENAEAKPEFTPIEMSDADKQWTFQSEEATNKIMRAHGAISGIMFGIDKATGFGNNADELETVIKTFDFQVIVPHRRIILNGMKPLFALIGYTPSIKSASSTGEEASVSESYTGIQISSAIDVISKVGTGELTKSQAIIIIESMLGFDSDKAAELFIKPEELSAITDVNTLIDLGEELNPDEWICIDERDVDYDEEDNLDVQVIQWNLSHVELTSTGTARPSAKSAQDATIDGKHFKVRYEYAGETTTDTREFCSKMVSAHKLYRKEDIVQMSDKTVNKGWGAHGADTYSIWLYKGGGSCHHKWVRKTFMSTTGIDPKNPNAPTVSTNKAEKEGYRVRNPKEVAMKPKDMKNEGFLKPRK